MISEADLEMAVPVPEPTEANPFALGWRWRDGGLTALPLTQADLLWQEEGDQIVTNDYHRQDMDYLYGVLSWRVMGQGGVRVLSDHCIDFQVEGLGILGPDVVLFNGKERTWDGGRGTFPVKDMEARPLYCFEISSPGTRPRDLRERLDQFFRAHVPVYILIDAPYGGGRRPQGIVAFQAGPDGYERLPPEPDGRVWIEVAEVWISLDGGRLACHTPEGWRIPLGHLAIRDLVEAEYAREEADERAEAEQARADTEQARADAEQARADAEKKKTERAKKRADAEKAARIAEQARFEVAEAARITEQARADAESIRADEATARLAALEAELKRLRGETN